MVLEHPTHVEADGFSLRPTAKVVQGSGMSEDILVVAETSQGQNRVVLHRANLDGSMTSGPPTVTRPEDGYSTRVLVHNGSVYLTHQTSTTSIRCERWIISPELVVTKAEVLNVSYVSTEGKQWSAAGIVVDLDSSKIRLSFTANAIDFGAIGNVLLTIGVSSGAPVLAGANDRAVYRYSTSFTGDLFYRHWAYLGDLLVASKVDPDFQDGPDWLLINPAGDNDTDQPLMFEGVPAALSTDGSAPTLLREGAKIAWLGEDYLWHQATPVVPQTIPVGVSRQSPTPPAVDAEVSVGRPVKVAGHPTLLGLGSLSSGLRRGFAIQPDFFDPSRLVYGFSPDGTSYTVRAAYPRSGDSWILLVDDSSTGQSRVSQWKPFTAPPPVSAMKAITPHHGKRVFVIEGTPFSSETAIVLKGPTANQRHSDVHAGCFAIPRNRTITAQVQMASQVETKMAIQAQWLRRNGQALIPTTREMLVRDVVFGGQGSDWLNFNLFVPRKRLASGDTHWRPKFIFSTTSGAPLPEGHQAYLDCLYINENGFDLSAREYLDGNQVYGAWEGEPSNATSVYLGDYTETSRLVVGDAIIIGVESEEEEDTTVVMVESVVVS